MSNKPAVWPWAELGLEKQPDEPRDVKRAYSRRLKEIDADTDVEAFQLLRAAYEQARRISQPQNVSSRRGVIQRVPNDQSVTQPPAHSADSAHQSPSQKEPDDAESAETEPDTSPINPWQKSDLSNPDNLFRRMHNLIESGNLKASDWKGIMNADALGEPQISNQFQRKLVEFLISKTVPGSYVSTRRVELYSAINLRFGWISDGVGFVKRYPHAMSLQAEMAKVLREQKSMGRASRTPSQIKTAQAGPKPIPPTLWMLPFFIWFVLLMVEI